MDSTKEMTQSESPNSASAAAARAEEFNAKPAKKRPNLFVQALVATAVVGAGVGGYMWWQHASEYQETDDAFIEGHLHQLSARISGTVMSVDVADNQHVKAGQTLVRIDPKDFKISLDSFHAAAESANWQANEAKTNIQSSFSKAAAGKLEAQSAIVSARANVDRAEAALAESKMGVKMQLAQIKQREAELTRAKSDFDRYQSLVEDRAVTKQAFDKARQDKDVAEAYLESAREGYRQAQSRVQQAQQSLEDARANVIKAQAATQTADAAQADAEASKRTYERQQAMAKQAEAQYDNAKTQLSYTDVVAPVSGKVGAKTVEVGQHVERGQAMLSIVSDEKWVVANFKETQLTKMRVGQEVEVKIDAFPNKVFKARVDSISPASGAQFALLPPDNATGNFTKVVQRISVKIVFDRESLKGYEDLLTPGMSVVAEVHVGK